MDSPENSDREAKQVRPNEQPESCRNPQGEGTELTAGPAGDGAGLEPQAETDLWIGRTRWQHFSGRIVLWLVGNVALAVLIFWIVAQVEGFRTSHGFWAIFVIFVVSAGAVLAPIVFRILGQKYRLTSQRLFVVRGILSQTIDQTELIRVDDVRVHKTVVDRIFRLGTVAILSTDVTDKEVEMAGIHAPEKVAEHIRGRMRVLRSKSLFVESL